MAYTARQLAVAVLFPRRLVLVRCPVLVLPTPLTAAGRLHGAYARPNNSEADDDGGAGGGGGGDANAKDGGDVLYGGGGADGVGSASPRIPEDEVALDPS